MKEKSKNEYVKRTQKDYSMSFKLQVVQEVENGGLGIKAATRKYGIQGNRTVTTWLRKYGTFDWENQTPSNMPKTQVEKPANLTPFRQLNLTTRSRDCLTPSFLTITAKNFSLAKELKYQLVLSHSYHMPFQLLDLYRVY